MEEKMDKVNIDLQNKVAVLQLCPIDNITDEEHLKAHERLEIHQGKFEYYKMYGQHLVPYSKEYLIRSNMEELLQRDKEKYLQFSPSFFERLKRKMDMKILKWKVKLLQGLADWREKHSKDRKG